MYATALVCAGCAHAYPLDARYACDRCFGPLEPQYDLDAVRAVVSRERIAAGPHTLWRYADLLPTTSAPNALPVGLTPLLPAPRLAAELGLRELYLKVEAANPTHSFKDRVVSVASSKAVELGYRALACASTGNLAGAVAAQAAALGLDAFIFVPADLEREKIISAAVPGATVFAVDGSYDDVNRLCAELAYDRPWGFVNINVRSYYAQGSKTLAYETTEQLGWRLPDQVVAPIASGSMYTKVAKGFDELVAVGLVEGDAPRLWGAQAEGCSPVATAWAAGSDDVVPVRPDTIAKSLAIGAPADGGNALAAARRTGGGIAAVSDDEVVDAIGLLARTTGIFTETAGGVTVATLSRLARDGALDPDGTTVALITGDGLKTPDAALRHVSTIEVAADVDEVDAALEPLALVG